MGEFQKCLGEKFRVGQAAGEVKAKGMSETRLLHTAGCFGLLPHACCHVCVPETSTACGLCSVLQESEPQEEFRRTGLSWRLNLYLYKRNQGAEGVFTVASFPAAGSTDIPTDR